MSKVISCWSNKGHQTGVTTHTALIAYMFAKEYKDKTILTLDMGIEYNELEKILNAEHEKGLNLDSLKNKLTSKKIDKNVFCESCVAVEKNLYNLNSGSNFLFDFLNDRENIKKCLQIIDIAAEIFDIVIIDNQVGYSALTNAINNRANMVLNFIKQNSLRLEKVSENYKEKIITIVNEYSENKSIDLKELKEYDFKPVYLLNYCEEITYFENKKELKKTFENESGNEVTQKYLTQLDKIFNVIAEKVELKQAIEKKESIFIKFLKKGEK